jgi:quinol monooxygenase YgiN
MEAGMRSEQVYWVFTVTVDQMDKFTPLIPKLVAATEKEPGALQFEFNIGNDQKTVDIFERYMDSKAALFHQAESFGPFSKEFFAVAKLTRWVIYGTPSDEFKKANADFHPIFYDTIRWFCQVTGLASGLEVASLVADIVERLPDAALDPAILSEQS